MSDSLDPPTQNRRFTVPNSAAGSRLDSWLAGCLPNHSRSEVQRWIHKGWVLVNQDLAKSSYRVADGDHVSLHIPPREGIQKRIEPESIPLDIIHEDAHVIVLNKQPGIVVHPSPGHERGTLVHALMFHCPNMEGVGGEQRPGIVHRLDKDTSGLIIVAKNDRALRFLQEQFKNRCVYKEYLALLEGRVAPPAGRITAPVGRHPVDRKRQAVLPRSAAGVSNIAREAITDYELVGLYSGAVHGSSTIGNFSLVTAAPKTGRTHQLRVHFAWRHCPIVGDTLYGYKRQRISAKRMFLHAHRLRIVLPGDVSATEFEAPLPSDLRQVLAQLTSL